MVLLIVEDNARMRRVMRSCVGDLAESVHECGDGAEALAAYDACRPDWVLMDVRMKRLDGISATRRIKAAHPEANVVIVSNYDDAETREAARVAGASHYVAKEDLLAVRRILGGGRSGEPAALHSG
jgi:CheY-like chemotaxis protein